MKSYEAKRKKNEKSNEIQNLPDPKWKYISNDVPYLLLVEAIQVSSKFLCNSISN